MGMRKYIGHHGTSRDNSQKIIKTDFTINYQHVGWLGKGVYFYHEDSLLAKEYAEDRHSGKIVKVIECDIEVPKDKVFDTTEPKNRDIFFQYREELKKKIISEKIKVRSNNRNDFDGKVYDIITRAKNISMVRAETFTPLKNDREYNFPESRVPNGIELCMKSTNYIKSKHICI